jgi:hypothetical protein
MNTKGTTFFPPSEAGEAYELINGDWTHMPDKNHPTAFILKQDMIASIDEHIQRVVKDVGGINGFVLSALSLNDLAKVRAFVMSFPPYPVPWMIAEKVSHTEVYGNVVNEMIKGDDKSINITGDNAKVVIAEPKDKATVNVEQH